MLILGFLGLLVIFLAIEARNRMSFRKQPTVDNSVLHDQTLAYHLDWQAIQDQKFLTYLYVKKVNAVVRYQNLAGVDYTQAQSAIEHLLAHPELLPEVPQKRRPPLPEADDQQLHDLIANNELDAATSFYAHLVDVDQFTAQHVVQRLAREHYLMSIEDSDLSQSLQIQDEVHAMQLLQERYDLTQDEALQVIAYSYNSQIDVG